MEIGAETTTGGDDRILENPADVLVIVRRNQVTHRHCHHPRYLHHQIDIHEGCMIADNPPLLALGVEPSVVHFGMSDGLKDSDLEQ